MSNVNEQNNTEASLLISRLRLYFSDFSEFSLLENDLQQLIHLFNCGHEEESFARIKVVLKQGPQSYLHFFASANSESKSMIKLVLFCLVALYLSTVKVNQIHSCTFPSIDELLAVYPEFHHLRISGSREDLSELHHLLNFRNYLALLLRMTSSEGKKIQFLKAIGRIDGSFGDYHPGTGQKSTTSYRCLIYYRESNLPIKRDAYLNIPPNKLSMRLLHNDSLPNSIQKRKTEEPEQCKDALPVHYDEDSSSALPIEKRRKLFERSNTKNLLEDSNEKTPTVHYSSSVPSFPLLPRWNSEHIEFDEDKDQLIPYEGSFSEVIPEDLGLTQKELPYK